LFRNENLRKTVSWDIPYLSGGETEQATLVGTRSGASAIAVWTVMKLLGREGYRKIVRNCMRLTLKLAEDIPKIEGLDMVAEPTMNVVGLKSDVFDIRRIAGELRAKKWAVSLFPRHIRIVIGPHVKERHVERFLQDLKKVADELRG
jgi:tyrosine decarboxylase/aspartate 1-decarboxylase